MAAGPALYERGTGFPDTFLWAVISLGSVELIWGGKAISNSAAPSATSVVTPEGTFYRGAFKTTVAFPPVYSVDYYEISREIPAGDGPGTIIYGADYNAVQVKVDGILGDGTYYGGPTNGYGYGQTTSSDPVSPTSVITAAQWDNLMSDLNKIVVHQRGNTSTYITSTATYVTPGNRVAYGALELAEAIASGAVANRLDNFIPANYTITTGIIEPMANLVWGGSDDTPLVGTETTPSTIDSIFDVSFANSNQLHYFFNSGGNIVIDGKRDTSSTGRSSQEDAWYSLMPSLTVTIGSTQLATLVSAGVGVDVTLLNISSTTNPYEGANIKVYATYNTSKVTVRVEFTDSHLPTGQGPDFIRSGLVGYTVTRKTTTGAYRGAFDGPVPTITETNTFA